MRPGRAAVHTALPLVALAALAVLGALRPPAPPAPPSASGTGGVAPQIAGRVVTDGRPQVVPLRLRRVLVASVRPPAPRQAARLSAPHSQAVVAPRPPQPRPTAVPRVVTRDAYPYAADSSGDSDPWGFTKRQCVSYVAWRLAGQGRPLDNGRDHWGSALGWDEAAARLGYGVSARPSVGTVAHWDAGERSPYWSGSSPSADGTFVAGAAGHDAWVLSVYGDGSVLVAQYNGTVDRGYSTMRVKAPRFLSV